MRLYPLLLFVGLPFILHAVPITGTTAATQTTSALKHRFPENDNKIIKNLDMLENMNMYEHMDMYEHLNVFEQEDKK